jgi:hypothetical protein
MFHVEHFALFSQNPLIFDQLPSAYDTGKEGMWKRREKKAVEK